MQLQNSIALLQQAQAGGYAVGAFNAENMEMVQAIIAAAEELRAPVILQTTPSTLKYASTDLFHGMVAAEAARATVPVVLHLDHGDSVELCEQAAASGYTSIMYDGSKLPLDDNIAATAKVVAHNRALGLSTEAELGTVGGKEDSTEAGIAYTDPDEAVRFAAETGVDSFAVAIGTAHGFYKGEPHLDFERLSVIRSRVEAPLVLHGASGLSEADVKRAISLGICKVNFATELRCAYTEGVRAVLTDAAVFDPKKYGKPAREKAKALVMEKMRMCGCDGKA